MHLSKLGPVDGHNIDYTRPAEEVVQQCTEKLIGADADIIIGTSMGGWLASVAGSLTGIPFVAINPAINPVQSMMKHVGKGVDYQGKEFELTASVVNSYNPLSSDGCGLILLDKGDEVFDWRETHDAYHNRYSVVSFPEGSHRFEHMEASLPLIEYFFDRSLIVYGLGEN